jgi:hypothetical protein
MRFTELESMAERASRYVFSKTKLLLTALLITACAFLGVLALGVALWSVRWLNVTLFFLPFVVTFLAIMTTGVFIIRSYHDEVTNKEVTYKTILATSWNELIVSAYLFIPFIGLFLLLWLGEACHFFLKPVPIIGPLMDSIFFLGSIFWIFALLLLCLTSCFLIFCISPVIALKSLTRQELLEFAKTELKKSIFLRLFLFSVSIIPLALSVLLLWISLASVYTVSPIHHESLWILYGFIMMLPIALILSPALVFFFNMAAETHILIQKKTV